MRATAAVAARHAIITGGSGGIGLALVRRLAGLGARTSVIALDDDDLVRLRRSRPSVTCVGADVGDRDQAQAAVAACVDAQGPCDLLFTCAGIVRPGYFMEIPDAEFERQMRVNYFGTLWPIRGQARIYPGHRISMLAHLATAAPELATRYATWAIRRDERARARTGHVPDR